MVHGFRKILARNGGLLCGNHPANKVFVNVAETSAKKTDMDWKRKATQESKENRRRSKYSRTDNSAGARRAYSRHDNICEPDGVIDDIPVG